MKRSIRNKSAMMRKKKRRKKRKKRKRKKFKIYTVNFYWRTAYARDLSVNIIIVSIIVYWEYLDFNKFFKICLFMLCMYEKSVTSYFHYISGITFLSKLFLFRFFIKKMCFYLLFFRLSTETGITRKFYDECFSSGKFLFSAEIFLYCASKSHKMEYFDLL